MYEYYNFVALFYIFKKSKFVRLTPDTLGLSPRLDGQKMPHPTSCLLKTLFTSIIYVLAFNFFK